METLLFRMNGDSRLRPIDRWRKSDVPKPAEWFTPIDLKELRFTSEKQNVKPSSLLAPSLLVSMSEVETDTDPIQPILDAIDASRKLLELPDDWDEEGSPRYSEPTWQRATQFLRNHARWLWEQHDMILDAPRISPGPHGSIDIYWKTEEAELLLNIPADPAKPLTCYGDSKSEFKVSGPLSDSDYQRGLWSWLSDGRGKLGEPSGR
jgi:hypothetical protein